MALVPTSPPPVHVAADRRIVRAGCRNELAWMQAGHWSDGRHREVALMLRAGRSPGATTTSIHRIERDRLVRLAAFAGDRIEIGRGTVTAGFENRGRSPEGEIETATASAEDAAGS
jgi:hypothetical protein